MLIGGTKLCRSSATTFLHIRSRLFTYPIDGSMAEPNCAVILRDESPLSSSDRILLRVYSEIGFIMQQNLRGRGNARLL